MLSLGRYYRTWFDSGWCWTVLCCLDIAISRWSLISFSIFLTRRPQRRIFHLACGHFVRLELGLILISRASEIYNDFSIFSASLIRQVFYPFSLTWLLPVAHGSREFCEPPVISRDQLMSDLPFAIYSFLFTLFKWQNLYNYFTLLGGKWATFSKMGVQPLLSKGNLSESHAAPKLAYLHLR